MATHFSIKSGERVVNCMVRNTCLSQSQPIFSHAPHYSHRLHRTFLNFFSIRIQKNPAISWVLVTHELSCERCVCFHLLFDFRSYHAYELFVIGEFVFRCCSFRFWSSLLKPILILI